MSRNRWCIVFIAQEAAESGGSPAFLIGLVVIMVAVWFVLIRPQQRQQKERKERLTKVEVGDDIVTVGGLHGRVVDLADDHMDLLVTEGIVLRYQREALMKIVGEEPEDEDDEADDVLAADEE